MQKEAIVMTRLK